MACSGSLEGSDKILVVVLSDVKAFVTSTIKKKNTEKSQLESGIFNIMLHVSM